MVNCFLPLIIVYFTDIQIDCPLCLISPKQAAAKGNICTYCKRFYFLLHEKVAKNQACLKIGLYIRQSKLKHLLQN